MRRSYLPETSHADQHLKQREKTRNPAAASSNGADQKKEAKTLERKPTEDINASAEAFIKNFRQHLLLQRLESIENYEQMLARGL